ncbi:ABC transporter substrate-binding protein [Ktedonobacter sp. SOSP1-52]|uniref:ABC transporter substrate-binding protein n=1 Tax=Ktedonobacter sp. SOSP1-52 TaxID=2778366 RepID=UPI00191586D2|nr:ABC transporter substrate-binding protein [Ktedonobacter sp. SOSP1-52]
MSRLCLKLALCFALAFLGGTLLFPGQSAHADTGTPPCSGIQYGAFSQSISFIVAQRQGYFAQEGLSICYNQVTGSVQQFNDLLAGNYDLISTASDNVVNRYVNQQLPLQLFSSFDRGTGLDLVANTSNGINSIEDLRGKSIIVDAPDSGFAYALEKILLEHGLSLANGDYSFQPVGGVALRYQQLLAGQNTSGPVYATLLSSPFTVLSTYQPHLKILDTLSNYVNPYQGTSLASTRTYAQAHPEVIEAFLRAMIRAQRYALDPANHDTLIGDIASVFNVSPQVANDILVDAFNAQTGESVNEELDTQGLINVINLRQQFNGFTTSIDSKQLAKSKKDGLYYDKYWKDALRDVKTVS